jgi:WhiB family redox-sensing transcriptional regulator
VLIPTAAALPAAAPVLVARASRKSCHDDIRVRRLLPWLDAEGCLPGEDPELFFPVTAAGPALAQVLAAKAVCFRCAVRAACLSYAVATGQAGIWGGTTQEERQAMRRSSWRPAREHSADPGSPSAAARHRANPGGQ